MIQLETITSRENRRLVHARKVRDGHSNTEMFVEGKRLVREALDSGSAIIEGYISDSFTDDELTSRLAKETTLFQLPDPLFRSISDTENPQGIALLAARPKSVGAVEMLSGHGENGLFVFLKEINNPSNLGSVIRTCEAAGVSAVFLSKGSADPYSPKALRAAMGSAFRIPVAVDVDLTKLARAARELKISTVAAVPSGGVSYWEADWAGPMMVLFGSEAHGLGVDDLRLADRLVTIPSSSVESLNLSVAVGVLLFEARRQRTAVTGSGSD